MSIYENPTIAKHRGVSRVIAGVVEVNTRRYEKQNSSRVRKILGSSFPL